MFSEVPATAYFEHTMRVQIPQGAKISVQSFYAIAFARRLGGMLPPFFFSQMNDAAAAFATVIGFGL